MPKYPAAAANQRIGNEDFYPRWLTDRQQDWDPLPGRARRHFPSDATVSAWGAMMSVVRNHGEYLSTAMVCERSIAIAAAKH